MKNQEEIKAIKEKVKEKNKEKIREKNSIRENKILKGILAGILSMILVVTVANAGLMFGWFDINKTIKFDNVIGAVEVGEKILFPITNYKNIGRPEMNVSSFDENIAFCYMDQAGNVVVTGVNSGTTTILVEAKGCRDINLTVNVADSKKAVKELGLEDAAIQAGDIDYYFLTNGDFFALSDFYSDYIGGHFRVCLMDEITFDNIYSNNYGSIKDEMEAIVSDGKYYLVTADIIGENLGGSITYGGMLNLIILSNGYDMAVYDSGWDTINKAAEISMADEDWLLSCVGEDFVLDKDALSLQGFSNADFSKRDAVKESWRAAAYKDDILFKKDGNLYKIPKDVVKNNSVKEAELVLDLKKQGKEVTLFTVYEDYLIYGLGNGYDTEEFRLYSFIDNSDILISNYGVKDFIIYHDKIYCSNYKNITAFDFAGNEEVIWQYNAFAFDIDNDYMYIFDGNSWEVMDINSHDDMGYIVTGIAGAYEADVVTMHKDHLFFTSYSEKDDELVLNILGLDGKLDRIGEVLKGASFDTFNGLYYDQFILYTANAGETIIKIDLSTGERISDSFDRYGYYYTIELMNLDGIILAYTYDKDNQPHYIKIDPDTLSMSEIESMK